MSNRNDVISLRTAILCVDCEVISSSNARCDVCGSSALLSLSRVLGGPIREQAARGGWAPRISDTDSMLDGLFVCVDGAFSYSGGRGI
jgi:hypothetical protein